MNKDKVFAAILVLVVGLTSVSTALVPTEGPGFFEETVFRGMEPTEASSRAWENMVHESEGVWLVRWNPRTGIPASLIGAGNSRNDAEPQDIAKSFLGSHAELYGFDRSADHNGDGLGGLQPLLVRSEGGSHHVKFGQYHDGIRVFASGLTVHVAPEGEIRQVTGEYVPVPSKGVKGSWVIDADTALDLALSSVGAERQESYPRLEQPEMKKQYYFDGRSLICTWLVNVALSSPKGDWQMLIDAEDGRLLFRNNMINTNRSVTGSGIVYPVHPIAGDLERRDLRHLNALDALVSQYARVRNADGPEASEPDGRYHYETSNTHFDEAMVYYHVIAIHAFFRELGFNGLDNGINVTVHVGTNYDNAYYSPWGGLFFGDGNLFNPLAWEAAVIYHEYIHAVTGRMTSLIYSGEAGAMNEAFSDYFPCSIERDRYIGEYVAARRPKPYLRDMENTKVYPDDIANQVHQDGEIYAGALWDLEKVLGSEITWMLAHRSRYHLPYRARFIDGLDGMIAVDRDLYNGKYEETIRTVFGKRGIVSSTVSLNELQREKRFFELVSGLR